MFRNGILQLVVFQIGSKSKNRRSFSQSRQLFLGRLESMPHLHHWYAAAVCATSCAGLLLISAALLRARRSRYPALLYVCAAYLALLHGVWIAGLLARNSFASEFALLNLLTFPWSASIATNMTLAGFDTFRHITLNYARFVLGFGGLQCLLLTLLVWELRPKPRKAPGRSADRPKRSVLL